MEEKTAAYVYSVSSAPASVNFSDYKYDNMDGMAFMNHNEGVAAPF